MHAIDDTAVELFLRYLDFERDRLAAARADLKTSGDRGGHAYECKLQALTVLEIRDAFLELWRGGPSAFDAWAARSRRGWPTSTPPPASATASPVVDLSKDAGYQAACAREDEFRAAVEEVLARRTAAQKIAGQP